MTGTTNDGAGRGPRFRPRASRPTPPSVPLQRAAGADAAGADAAGADAAGGEVIVALDASDESLDRVVAAAREAQAAGAVLHLVAAAGPQPAGSPAIARERLTHQLDLAAEVARALCPGLAVEVTGPPDEQG